MFQSEPGRAGSERFSVHRLLLALALGSASLVSSTSSALTFTVLGEDVFSYAAAAHDEVGSRGGIPGLPSAGIVSTGFQAGVPSSTTFFRLTLRHLPLRHF